MRKVLWRRGVPCVRRRDERKKEKKACIRRVDKIAARLLFPFFSFSFLPFLSSLSSSSSQDRAGRERKLIHAAVKLPRGNYAYYAPRVRSLCELPAFNKKANDDKEIRGETSPPPPLLLITPRPRARVIVSVCLDSRSESRLSSSQRYNNNKARTNERRLTGALVRFSVARNYTRNAPLPTPSYSPGNGEWMYSDIVRSNLFDDRHARVPRPMKPDRRYREITPSVCARAWR